MKKILRLSIVLFSATVLLISSSAFMLFDGPVLTPAKPVYNFDTAVQGTIVRGKIPFQNTGKSNLFIMYATVSSSDVAPHWPTAPVMPGKWDTISFEFSTGSKLGRQNREITVVDNAENQQSILKISGVVVADTAKSKTAH